jgi:hypothetical protein
MEGRVASGDLCAGGAWVGRERLFGGQDLRRGFDLNGAVAACGLDARWR